MGTDSAVLQLETGFPLHSVLRGRLSDWGGLVEIVSAMRTNVCREGDMRDLVIFATLFSCASPALAHHSDAALDMTSLVTVTGTVAEFSLQNPHAYFSVLTLDQEGHEVEWTVQMASRLTMTRLGWTPESLTLGEEVTVGLNPARDGKPYGLMASIEKANGSTLPNVGDARGSRSAAAPVVARATSIAGKWMVDRGSLGDDYPGGLDQLMRRDLVLTERGKAEEAAFRVEDDPLLRCIGRPTPGDIVYTDLYPLQIEINDDGSITIRSQFFDEQRTVYMDGRPHPPASERFHEGHSIGRWEGQTLVVDTANFADHRSPYQNGVPSGARKRVVQRFELADGGTRLAVEFTLEDPEFIERPMTHRRKLIYAPQADMSPFDCDLESTRRYLIEE
jgi:hypothetical protein